MAAVDKISSPWSQPDCIHRWSAMQMEPGTHTHAHTYALFCYTSSRWGLIWPDDFVWSPDVYEGHHISVLSVGRSWLALIRESMNESKILKHNYWERRFTLYLTSPLIWCPSSYSSSSSPLCRYLVDLGLFGHWFICRHSKGEAFVRKKCKILLEEHKSLCFSVRMRKNAECPQRSLSL